MKMLMISKQIIGKIRGMSQWYADGLERLEIHIIKEEADDLPHRQGSRVAINLVVGGERYAGGLRATRKCAYVWICPDLRDAKGQRVSLARILLNGGFKKNHAVALHVDAKEIHVKRDCGVARNRS